MSTMEFNLNLVEQISVRYTNGQEVIYKGRGIEKFRRLVAHSSSYTGSLTTIIEEDDPVEEEVPKNRKPKKNGTGQTSAPSMGYATANLQYANAANKDLSPVDIARQLQQQAAAAGFKFD